MEITKIITFAEFKELYDKALQFCHEAYVKDKEFYNSYPPFESDLPYNWYTKQTKDFKEYRKGYEALYYKCKTYCKYFSRGAFSTIDDYYIDIVEDLK